MYFSGRTGDDCKCYYVLVARDGRGGEGQAHEGVFLHLEGQTIPQVDAPVTG